MVVTRFCKNLKLHESYENEAQHVMSTHTSCTITITKGLYEGYYSYLIFNMSASVNNIKFN